MLLIAPDKYKGTISATEAAGIIASAIRSECMVSPMADGGEGTAELLCRGKEWETRNTNELSGVSHRGIYYYNPHTCEVIIDSSAVIGLQSIDRRHHDLLKASSAPLGKVVRILLENGCRMVTIGIGGTSTCDGGAGFLEALGDFSSYRSRLRGLSDVQVPLLAPEGEASALMFAPQKGATAEMMPRLRQKLSEAIAKYGPAISPFDGAGGGVGYALASVIGCEVVPGAQFVLDSYAIDWSRVDLVITGEGCYDCQSATGKVVYTLYKNARLHGIPTVVLPGTTNFKTDSHINPSGMIIIPCDRFLPRSPLTAQVAAERLRMAAQTISNTEELPPSLRTLI